MQVIAVFVQVLVLVEQVSVVQGLLSLQFLSPSMHTEFWHWYSLQAGALSGQSAAVEQVHSEGSATADDIPQPMEKNSVVTVSGGLLVNGPYVVLTPRRAVVIL